LAKLEGAEMTLDELKKFCSDRDIRTYLNTPFSIGDWTYTSDGCIAARIQRVDSVPEVKLPERMTQTLPALFAKEFSNWVPVPVVTIQPDVECEECHGTMEVECNLGHIHDCEDCDGTGKQSGYTMDHKTMIGDTCFQDRYLALIQGWEIAVDPNDVDAAAGIRIGDVRGVLMPRRKD
jgi:hypothetical protein